MSVDKQVQEFTRLYTEVAGRPLDNAHLEQLERNSVRVVVTGRFKAGKSSVLNALVEERLLPVDVLPATGTVVELRSDSDSEFARNDGDGWKQADKESFENESTITHEHAAKSRWRLKAANVPDGFVFVDTPGVDEDEERRAVASEAVDEADLVVLVTRATQPLGIEETEWGAPFAEAGRLLIAVSAIDQVDAETSERLDGYLAERLDAPAVKVSAQAPDEAEGIDELRDRILDLAAGARRRAVEGVLRTAIDEISKSLPDGQLDDVDEARRLEAEFDSRRRQVLDAVREARRESEEKARQRARKSWPGLVEEILRTKQNWSSDTNPITSPKRFAEDIGDQVKGVAKDRVKRFVTNEIEPLVARQMEKLERRVAKINADLQGKKWIHSSLRKGKISTSAIEKQLSSRDIGGGDVAVEVGVTAAVSAALGYIIADIVLFYILGLISGFLNPVLLAAAAAVGLTIFVTGGKSALQEKARDKMADKIEGELSKDETRREIADATGQAVGDAFAMVEDAYYEALNELGEELREHASELENRADRQRAGAERELNKLNELADQIVASI